MKPKTLEEKLIKCYTKLEKLTIIVVEISIILLSIYSSYETNHTIHYTYTSLNLGICFIKIVAFSILFISPIYFLFEYLKLKVKN